MKNTIFIFTLLAICMSLSNCDKTPEFVPGNFEDAEKLIIENDRISARYQVNDQEIKFIIEDLLNISDNRDDGYPTIDFVSMKVDINNNNLPDNNVDKNYGISSNGTPCAQFILQEGSASTGCLQEDGFSYESRFTTSDKSSENHIIYELIIKKVNIAIENESIGLIFVMNGNDSGGSIPFLLSPLFEETIEFKL